ncbi:MAG TPA: helix-turn-helix transcriptional regulator [Patescibacteria group bacterium]|nr:helix-turn-helix transcriptional regulator [Patescibacteria group bacterium]
MSDNIYKNIRKALKLTQKEIADKLEISQGYWSSVERNEKIPGSEILISLKSLFNVSSEYLLSGGQGEMFAEEKQQDYIHESLKGIEFLPGKDAPKRKGKDVDLEALENWLVGVEHGLKNSLQVVQGILKETRERSA